MPNDTINSLWIGSDLTPIGVLSVRSFLFFKHPYVLWAYNDIPNLPKGAELRNAEEIVPREVYDRWFGPDVQKPTDFRRAKIHQHYSDYFRYKLLQRGGWWCDTDIVALKPFDFPQPYTFSWGEWPCKWMSEELKQRLGIQRALNNGTMKCPANSPVIDKLLEISEPKAITAEFPKWAEWNHPLSEIVCDLGLQQYVPRQPIFEPYGETNWKSPFVKDVTPPSWAYSLHLYNSQGVQDGKTNSLVSKLKSKYTPLM